jgi:hypothetical protein
MKMIFTAGKERHMIHYNDMEKCMADQSPKRMKKGLHLYDDLTVAKYFLINELESIAVLTKSDI